MTIIYRRKVNLPDSVQEKIDENKTFTSRLYQYDVNSRPFFLACFKNLRSKHDIIYRDLLNVEFTPDSKIFYGREIKEAYLKEETIFVNKTVINFDSDTNLKTNSCFETYLISIFDLLSPFDRVFYYRSFENRLKEAIDSSSFYKTFDGVPTKVLTIFSS